MKRLVSILFLISGCGDASSFDAGVLCVPGQSVACVGTGGCSGGQTCAMDGKSFGPCLCMNADLTGPGPDLTATTGPDAVPVTIDFVTAPSDLGTTDTVSAQVDAGADLTATPPDLVVIPDLSVDSTLVPDLVLKPDMTVPPDLVKGPDLIKGPDLVKSCDPACKPISDCVPTVCVKGVCEAETAPDGSSCTGGTCLSGACCTGCIDGGNCVGGTSATTACGTGGKACKSCFDGSVCTADSCEAGKCKNAPLKLVMCGTFKDCYNYPVGGVCADCGQKDGDFCCIDSTCKDPKLLCTGPGGALSSLCRPCGDIGDLCCVNNACRVGSCSGNPLRCR